eukprot:5820730-Ditylum_brightwellii.AAC.1
MRLVIPATKFMAMFSKIGYLGIKKALDKNNVNYDKYMIVQYLDLDSKLEQLGLKHNNMYPYARGKLIKKALRNFPKLT